MILDVGKFIQKARKRKGWSQETFAFEMKTSQSTVSRLEKNRISCDIHLLVEITTKTNAQDLLMAMIFGLDPAVVSQLLQLLPSFIGGLLLWILSI